LKSPSQIKDNIKNAVINMYAMDLDLNDVEGLFANKEEEERSLKFMA
jgi:hypothetical protein